MNTLKKPLTAFGLAILTAGAMACTATGDQSTGSATAASGVPAAHVSANTTGVSQARRAVGTAEEAVGAGKAFDLDRDRYRGARVWEVEVDSGSARPIEVKVSQDGRTVVRQHRDDPDSDVNKVRQAKVDLADALGKARAHGDGALTDGEIDIDHGRLVWDVTFKRGVTETEVTIDALTGELVGVEHEIDD